MEHEKIDWSQAPEWANWWSSDRTGCYWWPDHPVWVSQEDELSGMYCQPDGGCEFADASDFGTDFGGFHAALVMRPPQEDTSELPATSSDACASEPSQEFKYTWWEPASAEYGQWHRSKEAANSEARSNFLDFKGKLSERRVLLVECVGIANAGSHQE
jgi:hypothetical protein